MVSWAGGWPREVKPRAHLLSRNVCRAWFQRGCRWGYFVIEPDQARDPGESPLGLRSALYVPHGPRNLRFREGGDFPGALATLSLRVKRRRLPKMDRGRTGLTSGAGRDVARAVTGMQHQQRCWWPIDGHGNGVRVSCTSVSPLNSSQSSGS